MKGGQDAPLRIGVVGTGLAGLATAYLLQSTPFFNEDGSQRPVEVHVFEKNDTLGMDSSSVSVTIDENDGTVFRIDTPMRSINAGSHGRVWKLYKHLGVHLRAADFSYSFSRLSGPTEAAPPPYSRDDDVTTADVDESTQETAFIYEGKSGFNWPPLSLPARVRGGRAKASYVARLVVLSLSYVHLLVLAFFYHFSDLTTPGPARTRRRKVLESIGVRSVASQPLGEWCERHWVSKSLVDDVLCPLVAAVATVGTEDVVSVPVGEVLSYVVSTFGAGHFVSSLGVQEVVSLLSAPLPASRIHLDIDKTSISPSPSHPSLIRIDYSPSSQPLDFHHVVLATQANQARRLLEQFQSTLAPKLQKVEQGRIDALGRFRYVASHVVNHRDESVLPPHLEDRRDLNLVTVPSEGLTTFSTPSSCPTAFDHSSSKSGALASSSVQATHVLSRTHPSIPSHVPLLQTTNPVVSIDESKVISESWYERAVVTRESQAVLHRFLLPDPAVTRPSPPRLTRTRTGTGKGRKEGAEGEFGDLQGLRGVWLVGSYCAQGIPLLEGCVQSGERVVAAIARAERVNFTMPF